MKTNKKIFKKKYLIISLIMMLISTGCEDFLEVEDPIGEINPQFVFNNESTATASVTTLYNKLREDVLVTGRLFGLSSLMGLYTDELDYYGQPGNDLEFLYNHQILPENTILASVWNNSYNLIYLCNSILEGLDDSGISEQVRNQLYGETLFVRSLVYFYLINLFGDIPFTTGTDYKINKSLNRTSKDIIYNNIIEDLLKAHSKTNTEYTSSERIRANRFAVSAMLARVFLYRGDWQSSELYASEVINSTIYQLETDLTKEFLISSSSAILQLKNEQDLWTNEASIFIFEFGPPAYFSLSPLIADSFEEGDLRRISWVKEVGDENQTWYMSNKYKRFDLTGPNREYSTILRLSEQYLIRAEARLKNGNNIGAMEDINLIRNRAGLSPVIFPNNLDEVLIQERKSELFCEQGHRWFDLKRWGLAQEVLSPVKANWREAHLLLPLPQSELDLNSNLRPQNPGY